MRWYLGLPVILICVSCGPIPVLDAEQQCLEPARLAERPRGSFSVMADSSGNVGTNLSIGISSDYLQGKDPDQVYDACVVNRSGQHPTRPYSLLPQALH